MNKIQLRHYNKLKAKQEARIIAEKSQNPVKKLTIVIEWKKSRQWGLNPHATAQVYFHDGAYIEKSGFTASGCGYDKESTVISDIFNTFLHYKLHKRLKKKVQFDGKKILPYGISIHSYKSGINLYNMPFPAQTSKYYSGGIGTSCYYDIAISIGGIFESVANSKTMNVFTYTDKSKGLKK